MSSADQLVVADTCAPAEFMALAVGQADVSSREFLLFLGQRKIQMTAQN